jgi:hypothetical protein
VARFRLCIATFFAVIALIASLLHGQVSDEDKTPNDKPRPTHHPSPSVTPKPSAKKKKSPTPSPKKKSSSKEKSDDSDDESPTPKPKKSPAATTKSKAANGDDDEAVERHHPTPSKSKSASSTSKSKKKKTKGEKNSKSGKKKSSSKTKKKKAEPEPEKTPKPTPAKPSASGDASPTPARAVTAPKPSEHPTPAPPAASPTDTSAQLTIEKSGFEQSEGLQPPPSPPPKRSWWPWGRRTEKRYTYLTRSVIDQIRRAPVASNRWKVIVVHNSGTRQGNARVFDYYHRRVRRMKNGLAYHFVIGNGTSTGNGEIEIGDRWRRQINGGHVHSDFLNNISLGICLVGDFNRDQPTRAQLDSCEELVRYLRERCGTADGRAMPVRPHRDVNPPRWATDCPGDAFPYPWFRKF